VEKGALFQVAISLRDADELQTAKTVGYVERNSLKISR
jgi:hypothetical protein